MSIFKFNDDEALGKVRSVDTATVVVEVGDVERLSDRLKIQNG
jgi:hypothetical protein